MKDLVFIETEIKMPLMSLPVRTVCVHLPDRILMISPGSKMTKDQFDSAGQVTDLVAPNLFHAAGIEQAMQHFPQAKVWGVLGLKDSKPSIKWSEELTSNNWQYHKQITAIEIKGMPKVNEVVFVHHPSKTLIVTDLCFNLINAKGIGARIILGLFGTYKKLGVSKFFLKFTQDKSAAEESFKKILEQDFDNLIVSHGDNIIGGAKDKLRAALNERGFKV